MRNYRLGIFRMIGLLLLLSSGLWCTLPAFGQTELECRYTIRGKVMEEKSAAPVPGATIFIRELGIGAITDESGEYVINQVCGGHYHLYCSYVGYHTDTVRVEVSGMPVYKTFTLAESDSLLETVIISGEKLALLPLQPTDELQGLELDRTRGQSLGESLKNIVGVTSIQTGATISKPVIHGLHSNRVLILNNGIRQEGQQWGSEHAPEIDPFIARKISVIKGAASVRYGSDAIGGVVLVEPGELPYTPGINGEVNVVGSTNGRQGVVSAILQGGFKKYNAWSWRLQGTAKRSGNVHTPDYHLKNTGLGELNFSTTLGYRKEKVGTEFFYSQFNSDIGIFSGSHIGNITDLENAFRSDRPLPEYSSGFSYRIERPYQAVSHYLFKSRSYWKPGSLGTLSLTYAWQSNYRAEYDAHLPRGSQLDAPELRFRIQTHTTDLVWEHSPILRGLTGSVGLSGIYQDNNAEGRFLIPNFRNYGLGLFALERYVSKRWEAEAGVRYDTRLLRIDPSRIRNAPEDTERLFNNFSGTAGALYRLSSDLSIKANVGIAWRPPAVNELFSDGVHHGEAVYELGNPDMGMERAYNFTAGLVYKTERISLETDVYQYIYNNFIYRQPQFPPVLTIRGAFPLFRFSQTDALLSGLDAVVSYRILPALTWRAKYSIVRAIARETGEHLPLIPADRVENTLRYQIGRLGGFSNLHVSFGGLHVARQWRVAPESDFRPPPDGYWVFNADAGFTVPSLNNLNVGVSVNNVFNTRYRDYLNRFRYFADDLGRNVSVRLKYAF